MTANLARYQRPPAPLVARDGVLPPHDMDAEEAVLSAILLDTQTLKSVADLLAPDHFYSEAHNRIFEAALKVFVGGGEIDVITVGNQLRTESRIEQVGGMPYLVGLLNVSPSPESVRGHAECVFNMWRRREALRICRLVEAEITTGAVGADELQGYIESAGKSVIELANRNPRRSGSTMKEVITSILRRGAKVAKDYASGKEAPAVAGLTTSLDAYDAILGGMLPGNKITIAARPGRGKSVLGLQICRANALRGVGTAFFATEQKEDELGVRIIAATTGINTKRVKRFIHVPTFADAEWGRLTEAATSMAKLPMHMETNEDMTIDDVCTKAIALANSFESIHGVPLKLIAVDYLQRLAPSKRLSPHAKEIDVFRDATVKLKSLAQKLNIVVVELAQQKMAEDSQGNQKKPGERMIEYCPKAEQEADSVMYIWERGKDDFVGIVTKVREGGEGGEFPIVFEKAFARMWAPLSDDPGLHSGEQNVNSSYR